MTRSTETPVSDRIERQILIRAPRARVWRALTTAEEFGAWFRVDLRGRTFAAGQRVQGKVLHLGYEHLVFDVTVERFEPEHRMTWAWHPAAVDSKVDYSKEPMTRVTFELVDSEGGTLLTVVESGFNQIPPERRAEAFRMNSGGWDEQVKNIARHVEGQ
jgi:uncharacterized protein YndB with AHSA1/START domain